MKRKEFKELRTKTVVELRKLVLAKKLEAEKAKMKNLSGKEKNLKVHKNLSGEIAKILTLIREKEIIESLEPKKEETK
jgi:ribosomal protein L29